MKTTKRENWKIPDCYPWQPVAKKPKPILNWNSFGYWNNFQIVIIQVVLSNEVIRQLFQFARKGITCIHTVKIICTHQFVCQYIFTESSIWQELKQNNRLFFFCHLFLHKYSKGTNGRNGIVLHSSLRPLEKRHHISPNITEAAVRECSSR